jgi:Fe-S-cluster-containing hydrogenase component 2
VRAGVLIRADGYLPAVALGHPGLALRGAPSYAPYTCTQCAEGWCMSACPVEAISISPVGAKVVLDDQCVGCKLCPIACPYGTMFYNFGFSPREGVF